MVRAGDRPRALTQPLGTENFTANWADELFTNSVTGAAEETSQNCRRRFGRYCCCHVRSSTPETCRTRRCDDS